MPVDLSFFDTRFVFFGDLMEFWRFAHRKHSQSDAGKNLAFFKFEGIIGGMIFIANTLFFTVVGRDLKLFAEIKRKDQLLRAPINSVGKHNSMRVDEGRKS